MVVVQGAMFKVRPMFSRLHQVKNQKTITAKPSALIKSSWFEANKTLDIPWNIPVIAMPC